MRIKIFDISNNETTEVDRALRYAHGQLAGFTVSWSSDSRWLAYSRDLENQHNAVFIYDYQDKKDNQVTQGFYQCTDPVFDPEGKYLYLFTNQSFQPYYSDIDNTFIYANSTQIAAISLKKETPSIMAPKNDTVAVKETESSKEEKTEKNKKDTTAAKKTNNKPVEIDFDGMEQRMVILPPPAGNYSALAAAKGKIIYIKHPNTGETDGNGVLKYFRPGKTGRENHSG